MCNLCILKSEIDLGFSNQFFMRLIFLLSCGIICEQNKIVYENIGEFNNVFYLHWMFMSVDLWDLCHYCLDFRCAIPFRNEVSHPMEPRAYLLYFSVSCGVLGHFCVAVFLNLLSKDFCKPFEILCQILMIFAGHFKVHGNDIKFQCVWLLM